MKLTIAKILLGKDVFALIRKYLQYKSRKSEGGRELTNGEKSHLGRLSAKVGERIIEMLI